MRSNWHARDFKAAARVSRYFAVPDPQDIVDVHGLSPTCPPGKSASATKKFLSVWFQCCHTYGRMYRNKAETSYEGRCPKCAAPVSATIGPGGTNRRTFIAR